MPDSESRLAALGAASGSGSTGGTGEEVMRTRTSSGRPTTTGPGRPVEASRMARATTSPAWCSSSSTNTALAVVENQPSRLNSWKESRPRSASGISPTKSTIAVESCQAVWIAIMALAAPGPRVTMAMPGVSPSRPSARAMKPAPPSWRVTTVWIGESCRPSSTSR